MVPCHSAPSTKFLPTHNLPTRISPTTLVQHQNGLRSTKSRTLSLLIGMGWLDG